MKNQKLPTVSKFSIVRQLCNYIPNHLVPKLARETGVDKQARTYDEWSHIVTLCYAQVTHSIGLNDVCDALQLNSGPLSALRGATPPTRNNLSHANKVRDPIMAEKLFWAVYEHLGKWLHAGIEDAHEPLPARCVDLGERRAQVGREVDDELSLASGIRDDADPTGACLRSRIGDAGGSARPTCRVTGRGCRPAIRYRGPRRHSRSD